MQATRPNCNGQPRRRSCIRRSVSLGATMQQLAVLLTGSGALAPRQLRSESIASPRPRRSSPKPGGQACASSATSVHSVNRLSALDRASVAPMRRLATEVPQVTKYLLQALLCEPAGGPPIIRWGPDASSTVLGRSALCTECGGKGAKLQHPRWAGLDLEGETFPASR